MCAYVELIAAVSRLETWSRFLLRATALPSISASFTDTFPWSNSSLADKDGRIEPWGRGGMVNVIEQADNIGRCRDKSDGESDFDDDELTMMRAKRWAKLLYIFTNSIYYKLTVLYMTTG